MKVSFVLAATDHGPLIVNRNDRVIVPPDQPGGAERGYGVGFQLLELGCFDPDEATQGLNLLRLKAKYRGEGVVCVDVGANIGAFTILWARHVMGWGSVVAFEPQERIFYALCGNIALNNLLNARAVRAVVGCDIPTPTPMHVPDYNQSGSYGSVSLDPLLSNDVGQDLKTVEMVPTTHLDYEFFDDRLDFLKIDVEGFELDVLCGGQKVIEREKPILVVEHLKSDKVALCNWVVARGYTVFEERNNLLCVHRDDPCLNHVKDSQ